MKGSDLECEISPKAYKLTSTKSQAAKNTKEVMIIIIGTKMIVGTSFTNSAAADII